MGLYPRVTARPRCGDFALPADRLTGITAAFLFARKGFCRRPFVVLPV